MLKNLKKTKSNNEFVRIRTEVCDPIDTMDVFVGVETSQSGNRVVKTSVLQEVDARDNFKGYKVSDFYIENLEAAGAVPTNTVQYYDGDIDKVLGQLDGIVENDK